MTALKNIAAELTRKQKRARRRFKRKRMRFDDVVAVTGSAGKTSTCRLVGAILETRGPVYTQTIANNAETIPFAFKPGPGVRNWVQEVSGAYREPMREALGFVRPNIGIVTCVQWDHSENFGSLDDIAETKSQLVRCLPETGVAILNADDERVAAMAEHTRARTITYGIESAADIRATDIRASIEDGLRVTATDGTDTVEVRTRFIGKRWAQSVLAALACGKALGIPLAICAEAMTRVGPQPFKESVHERDGVTFIFDVRKGAYWIIPSCLETVAETPARRKIVVLGTFRHVVEDLDATCRKVAHDALAVADRVMFFGEDIARVKPLLPEYDGRLSVHESFEDLLQALRETIRPGDLVYVKGGLRERLERIWYALNGDPFPEFRIGPES